MSSGYIFLIQNKALLPILSFSTSFLCAQGFSTLTNIENKKRENKIPVEGAMRVCLSTMQCPRIKDICKTYQTHISH